MEQGRISKNDLMHRLAKSKMVMEKVESGDYSGVNTNQEDFIDDDEMDDVDYNKTNLNTFNEEKIRNSKLPDEIKRVMLENPIPQISLNDDLDIVKGAKKLMERQGTIKKKTPPQQQTSNMDTAMLSNLIENIVRKVMDEKLNQILTAQQNMTINENLVIRVGNSTFKGKITGVNKIK